MNALLRGVFAFLLSCSLCACAAQSSYYGIDTSAAAKASGAQSAELLQLARSARAGSKQAQLELGIRFEEGDGVPQSNATARALYSEAASDTQLKQTSFVPDGGSVRAETTYLGVENGLTEAQFRLDALGLNEAGGVEATVQETEGEAFKRLLTRLATLTDYCHDERRAYRRTKRGVRFERSYLQAYPDLQQKGGSGYYSTEVHLACLLGADEEATRSKLSPDDQELVELVDRLPRVVAQLESPIYVRLKELGDTTARSRSKDATFLSEVNAEIVGAQWGSRLGYDDCRGGRFCRPLSRMCSRPMMSGKFDHEPLAQSFQKLCDLHQLYLAARFEARRKARIEARRK